MSCCRCWGCKVCGSGSRRGARPCLTEKGLGAWHLRGKAFPRWRRIKAHIEVALDVQWSFFWISLPRLRAEVYLSQEGWTLASAILGLLFWRRTGGPFLAGTYSTTTISTYKIFGFYKTRFQFQSHRHWICVLNFRHDLPEKGHAGSWQNMPQLILCWG